MGFQNKKLCMNVFSTKQGRRGLMLKFCNSIVILICYIIFVITNSYAIPIEVTIDCSTSETYRQGIANLRTSLGVPVERYQAGGYNLLRLRQRATFTPHEGMAVHVENFLGAGNNVSLLMDPGDLYILGFRHGSHIYMLQGGDRLEYTAFGGLIRHTYGTGSDYESLEMAAHLPGWTTNNVRDPYSLNSERILSGIRFMNNPQTSAELSTNGAYAILAFALTISESARFNEIENITSNFISNGRFDITVPQWRMLRNWRNISGSVLDAENDNVNQRGFRMQGMATIAAAMGILHGCKSARQIANLSIDELEEINSCDIILMDRDFSLEASEYTILN